MKRFKNLNFVTIRGAAAPGPPVGGGVGAFPGKSWGMPLISGHFEAQIFILKCKSEILMESLDLLTMIGCAYIAWWAKRLQHVRIDFLNWYSYFTE